MEIIKIYNNNIIAVLLETNQIGLVTGKESKRPIAQYLSNKMTSNYT